MLYPIPPSSLIPHFPFLLPHTSLPSSFPPSFFPPISLPFSLVPSPPFFLPPSLIPPPPSLSSLLYYSPSPYLTPFLPPISFVLTPSSPLPPSFLLLLTQNISVESHDRRSTKVGEDVTKRPHHHAPTSSPHPPHLAPRDLLLYYWRVG